MNTSVTKQTLGRGYVVGAGVLLALALLAHAVVALRTDLVAAVVAVAGLVPALALAGTAYWLPRTGLAGEQMWTIAQWSGLGIAVLTLVNLAVLATGHPAATLTPVLLATGVAMGGATGVLVGVLVELRASARRLQRGNAVLGRVIQHNLRNDLTVVLGHLGELERDVSGDAADRVDRLASKIEDLVTTTEKARQIDVALAGSGRRTHPVDVVEPIEERLSAVRRSYPESTVETDLPDESFVRADWFCKTVVDNVVENVVVHSRGPPDLSVSIDRRGDEVRVRFVDDCPPMPENERAVFSGECETPLNHSTGVGLWLVRLVMERYGGTVAHEDNDEGGNCVELQFEAATLGPSDSAATHLGRLIGR